MVDQRMPGDDRFEALVRDPQYFERAWTRARARARQQVSTQVHGARPAASAAPSPGRLRRAS